jgi:trans-aconitate methyltransferase
MERDELLTVGAADKVGALDTIAQGYDPSNPAEQFDYWLKRLQARTMLPFLAGTSALELGCATGELSTLLIDHFERYHIVEGSAVNIEQARSRLPPATFTHALWEEYEPEDGVEFSDAILFNAVEHVEDPVGLLRGVSAWLAPHGRIHVVVPNGLSFHRLIGVELGLQPDPLALTPGDIAQGHHHNFTIDQLMSVARGAGLDVLAWRGIFLKVLPNNRMLDWDWPLILAMHEVSQRVPEHAAELYVCLHRAQGEDATR